MSARDQTYRTEDFENGDLCPQVICGQTLSDDVEARRVRQHMSTSFLQSQHAEVDTLCCAELHAGLLDILENSQTAQI